MVTNEVMQFNLQFKLVHLETVNTNIIVFLACFEHYDQRWDNNCSEHGDENVPTIVNTYLHMIGNNNIT